MAKKPFTTRLDEAALALAQRLAAAERRSVTSIIELAILQYAETARRHTTAEASQPKTKPRGRQSRD
jgi:hypothetical protein